MKKIIRLIICLFAAINVNAQTAPGIEWQNSIGGSGNDIINCIQQVNDGGYILGGCSLSNISVDKTENCLGNYDFWVVKIDAVGNIQWQNTIGGNNGDIITCVQQTNDGGYILGGNSTSNISGDKTENYFGGGFDFWIVKVDSIGNIIWQNTIGGNNWDKLNSIQQTRDGGYILGGYSDSNISGDKTENSIGLTDYWIVKTDAQGNIQWQNTIGGNSNDEIISIRQTTDGGYILGGDSYSNISGDKTENLIGGKDYWIVKTDSLGNIQWDNTIGGNADEGYCSVKETREGGLIIGGYSWSGISGDKSEANIGGHDFWVVKTDSSGNIQCQNTIGGTSHDGLYSIQQTGDGGYILGGDSYSNISGDKTENNLDLTQVNPDYWIVKTDSMGNILWDNTIGGIGTDYLFSIDNSPDGGVILGGFSDTNISGDKTENCLGGWDFWIIKLYPDTITSVSNFPTENLDLKIFPNPTKDELNISLKTGYVNQLMIVKIYDVFGKEILKQQCKSSNIQLQTTNLSKGIYFVEVISGKEVYRSKVVKE